MANLVEYDFIDDLDADIDKYQKHVRKLENIIKVGSAAGKKAAVAKLADTKANLDTLYTKRKRLVKEGLTELEGFGEEVDNTTKAVSVGFILLVLWLIFR